ncbi:hypothetical protein M514_07693, partial [Trichuris suis]
MNVFCTVSFAALIAVCWSTECGDISYAKKSPLELVTSRNESFVFPWNALIKWKFRPIPICLATIVQTDQWTTKSNNSNRVVTAAYCFKRDLTVSISKLDTFQVLVGFDYSAQPPVEGKAYQIKSKKIYKQLHGTEKIKLGVAVLELKEPIMFTEKVRPICVAKRGQKIPDNPLCFMPIYQKDKRRVKDFIAPVANHGNCAIWQDELGAAKGYCIYYSHQTAAKKLGSPLICMVGKKLVQFGIYTTKFNSNYKGTQKASSIGYANDVTLLTSIIAGKLYETDPSSSG